VLIAVVVVTGFVVVLTLVEPVVVLTEVVVLTVVEPVVVLTGVVVLTVVERVVVLTGVVVLTLVVGFGVDGGGGVMGSPSATGAGWHTSTTVPRPIHSLPVVTLKNPSSPQLSPQEFLSRK